MIASRIRLLLQDLNECNVDFVFRELTQFCEYGIEGSVLLLQTCLEHLYFHHSDLKNTHLEQVLVRIFKFLLDKPNFTTVFSQSLGSIEKQNCKELLEKLSHVFQLSLNEKFSMGLALCDSENLDTRMCAKKFSLSQIKEMCENPISESSAEQIQNIIFFLQQSEGLSKHVDDFKEILSLMQYKDFMSFVLTPWLPLQMHEDNFLRSVDSKQGSEENEADAILAELKKEVSMGDILKELGYGCTLGSAHCKEIFSRFSPLDEVTIAKILGTIINCHTGLEDNQSTLSFLESALDFKISNDLSPLSSWDIDVLVHTIKELAPYTDWVGVIENLDHEGFYVPDEEAFSFFMSLYRHACQDPFPLHAICKSVWRNSEGQVSILKYAVLAPPEVFTFAHSRRQLEYNKAALDHKIQVGNANHAWLCLDLLDVLCQLAERGHASAVRSMVGLPLRDCPEILLLGMSRIKTAYNLLQNEISLTVFPMLVKNPSSSDMILYLWHVNPNLVLRGILVIYNTEPECLIRILDVCQELKILSPVLDMIPSTAGIRLAVIVSRKGLIDLEKWLANNLIAYKDLFFEECLNFLKENQLGRSRDVSVKPFEPTNAVANHNNETRFTFMKVLKEHVGLITSTELPKEMERLHITITDSGPNLRNGGSGGDSTNADGFPEDVEAEASSFFHQLYFGQMEVDAVIQMLGRFKESSVKKEQLIFECMIANLFEEYKFFPKYPEKQLKIAAILFGSIIKHQLVTRLTLGIALRTILDALRKPPDSKMFVFATKALEQFVERMIEWPQYCNHILQISHMRSTHPELVAFIERALARISSGHLDSVDSNSSGFYSSGLSNSSSALGALNGINVPQPGQPLSSSIQQPRNENPLDDRLKVSMASTPTNDIKPLLFSGPQNASSAPYIFSSTGSVRPSRGVSSTRFGSALNIETLVAAAESREKPIEAPASEIQDKVSFIINNISTANMEAKAKEFIDVSNEQYYPWFAQYMVMKRASIEPNFHDLYLKFLDKINSKALIKEIVQATYENCKVLLGSELIKSSSEERSLLKNLGSWLGKLTIGRNQVLRAREIDPKSLIIEAYEKGLMIAVIPFTSKIMEPCQSSLAYQTPNPWTMGILGLLAEIYLMPNLKMNLKFDIEVLFKNLGVDMKDISPTSLLKHRKRQIEGNPDFSNKDVRSIQTQAMNHVELPIETGNAPNAGGDSNLLSQYTAPIPLSSSTLLEDEKLAALGLSDRLPSAQGHFQATPSQSPFSVSQLPTAMPNVGTHVIINQKLHSWGLDVQFQRVVPIVMDRAIKEIVNGIVQRSVSIATQTTKELVLKDYAMETDETRIYNAAHLMVASLAGSLAHVTCKEPLRSSISSQLINLLQGSSNLNELLEHAVQLATNDNLDLGCAIIEQAATDKAIQTIDAQITQQLSIRRKHGDGVGSTFFGAEIFAQGSVGVVPESLRPKPGHLSLSQQRVYEDFVRLPWQNQSSQSMHMGISTSSSASSLANTYGSVAGQLNVGYSSASTNESEAVSRSLDKASETIEPSSSAFLRCSSSSSLQNEPAVGVAEHSGSYSLSASNSSKALEPELYADAFTLVKELGVPLLPLSTSAAAESIGSSFAEASLSTRDALDKYQIISQKLETLMSSDAREPELQGIIAEVPDIILKCVSRDEAALAVAQKVFKGLYEDASNDIHVNPSLAILAAIRDVCKLVVKELTSWVIYSDEDRKFNKDITLGLIHHELLNLGEYNVHMAKLIDGGRNKAATAFVIALIQALVVEDSKFIAELHNLVDALAKIASKPGTPESLQQLVEIVKNPAASSAGLSGITSEKEDKERHSGDTKPANEPSGPNEDYSSSEPVGSDPAGFREQVSMLFIEWCRTCELPGSNDSTHFILQLYHNGLLKGDDMTDCFFRILTDASVAHCLTSEVRNPGAIQASQQAQNLSFFAIDHYARLVLNILKVEHGSSKLLLLSKILDVTVRCILKDSEEKNTSFNPRPYFRLFINWLLDLVSLDPVVDSANYQMLTAFANTFHALQPMKLPAFSFAWLELVSHRSFMPKLLTGNALKGWGHAKQLLVDLFQFLEPFLRNAELGVPVHFLYKGTIKVLLLLLHDFPEFLCDYHFAFCDVIPPSCIQMRNIILGAFPCNKRLPDPSTPNLKIDLLPEIREPPRVLSEVDTSLKANQMKTDVDEYLRTRQQGSSFLTDLKQRLLLPPSEAAASGTLYNVPLINSLVLYAGMQAIQSLPESHGPSGTMVMVDAAMDIYQTLVVDLDTEGRYLFLNAVANQLRYPNNHTHYFSFILLFLFSEASQEIIQEQITRVLLERLIATRPHPWGLLITFIELIKNPRYSFWSRSFIRCAPEIEKLFESVARSCSGKPMDDSTVRG